MRLAVAPTNSPRVFSCIHVKKKPNMRANSPSLACVLMPASISSNQTTAGAIDSSIWQACANALSGVP